MSSQITVFHKQLQKQSQQVKRGLHRVQANKDIGLLLGIYLYNAGKEPL